MPTYLYLIIIRTNEKNNNINLSGILKNDANKIKYVMIFVEINIYLKIISNDI